MSYTFRLTNWVHTFYQTNCYVWYANITTKWNFLDSTILNLLSEVGVSLPFVFEWIIHVLYYYINLQFLEVNLTIYNNLVDCIPSSSSSLKFDWIVPISKLFSLDLENLYWKIPRQHQLVSFWVIYFSENLFHSFWSLLFQFKLLSI